MPVNGTWLRPSEAMRLGSFATDPLVGQFYGYDATEAINRACALGAMYFALGASFDDILSISPSPQLDPYRRFLKLTKTWCPVCQTQDYVLFSLIVHLNDYHWWNRLEIADWLAEIEESVHGQLPTGEPLPWQLPTGEPSPLAVDAPQALVAK